MNDISDQESGKVAVVTGAASGIGQAFAQRLAREGRTVVLVDIQAPEETTALIEADGGRSVAKICDLTSAPEVRSVAQSVLDEWGRVDILVHNAGIFPLGVFEQTTWDTWRRIMDLNLDAMFHLTQAFLPGMREAGWGRIVAMASTTFHAGTYGLVAYTASKGGIIGFVRSLASEVGASGVTVNAIAPSLVRTPGSSTGIYDELGLFDTVAERQAIPRVEVPDDLHGALAFLTSDDAAFVTGQTLVVDGGWVRA